MNRTHLEHALYAVFFQAIIGFAFGDWWAGAAFGAAFFLGREHAQAEHRARKAASAETLPIEILALRPGHWNLDSVLDFVAPAIAVVVVALLAG